jgi:hypothetical protein
VPTLFILSKPLDPVYDACDRTIFFSSVYLLKVHTKKKGLATVAMPVATKKQRKKTISKSQIEIPLSKTKKSI